jgi:hypothetical protein
MHQLTWYLKCVAMNRTLTNVLFGGIGSNVPQNDYKIEGTITKTNVDETVEALSNSDNVILVSVMSATMVYLAESMCRSLDTAWPLRRLSMPSQRLFAFCALVVSRFASPFILWLDGTSLSNIRDYAMD